MVRARTEVRPGVWGGGQYIDDDDDDDRNVDDRSGFYRLEQDSSDDWQSSTQTLRVYYTHIHTLT